MENKTVLCKNWKCIENHINQEAVLEGLFRKYSPSKAGKGAHFMFYDWEILLEDGSSIPVMEKTKKFDLRQFDTKKVQAEGLIFFGVIIGDDNPLAQSATGYRFDLEKIWKKN